MKLKERHERNTDIVRKHFEEREQYRRVAALERLSHAEILAVADKIIAEAERELGRKPS